MQDLHELSCLRKVSISHTILLILNEFILIYFLYHFKIFNIYLLVDLKKIELSLCHFQIEYIFVKYVKNLFFPTKFRIVFRMKSLLKV
jgi:hypothetical protein